MKQLAIINPENSSEEEIKNYSVREAARAIVVDDEGKIALLHVSKANYYKLPGGGLEGSEDKIVALERECQEEIGCDIEVTGEVGIVVEYRKFCKLKQISYCYLAKVKGKKGKPNFTDKEIENGFEEVWLSFDEARKALNESNADSIEGKLYIVPRDLILLKEAKSAI
mgnify:CR=1 FL=1